ncbi:Major intrinsic protein [Corchorus olitorius]|uniref:Major intrinsic protein n=1 Tax=Corchorus olitorius TaxID=93759 RepID=A0A1R3JDI9_9ROSI|nr:Major intrinsic protein [Corchorus olitorius]
MAATGNVGVIEDEENVYAGTRVRPFASTPRVEQRSVEDEKKQNPTSLRKIFSIHELFSLEVWRASLAELFGTAVLVFAMDTIVISSYETQTKTPHLIMSFLIAVVVAILLLATFPISGGHINPVISLAAAFTGLVSLSRAAVYILAQCVGGILGALALQAVVDTKIEQTFSLGGCTLTIVALGPSHGLRRHRRSGGPDSVYIDDSDFHQGLCRSWDEPSEMFGSGSNKRRSSLEWALGFLGWACHRLCGICPLYKAHS